MKYDKCNRCDLNYKILEEQYCKVCQDELSGRSLNDEPELLCPICYKYQISYDELMCARCAAKRGKKGFERD